jgi:hypothetical protein
LNYVDVSVTNTASVASSGVGKMSKQLKKGLLGMFNNKLDYFKQQELLDNKYTFAKSRELTEKDSLLYHSKLESSFNPPS